MARKLAVKETRSVKRRTFLAGAGAGGLVLGASGVFLGTRTSASRAKPRPALNVLDEPSFAVFVAIAERALMFDGADPVEIAHRVDEALRYARPEAQNEMRLTLLVLENALAGLLLRRSPRLFTESTLEDRARALELWGDSRVALIRGFTNSVRKLSVGSHYAELAGAKATGYPGPALDKPDAGPILRDGRISEPSAGILEGQTLGNPDEMTADVCIIGSGAGGAVTAAILARAGKKVIVLDEGGYFTSARFRARDDEALRDLYQEAGQRTTKDLAIAIFQGRAVGGTTVVNWTTSFRTPDDVLELWKTRWGVRLTPADLAPHFDAVEERLSISEIPIVLNRNNRLLYDGCSALGYDPHLIRRNVKGCAHTGHCGQGCPIDAKQSMLVSYLPDAIASGATVVSRARVRRLYFQGGRVTRATAALMDGPGLAPIGSTLSVSAKMFVLAAGAIGSPAILMRSRAPDPHGRLGRRTFLHPTIVMLGLHDEPVNAYFGAPQGAVSHAFARRGDDVGYFLEAAPVQPLLMAIAAPGFGVEHRAIMEGIERSTCHIALTIDGHHDDEGGTVELTPSGWPLLDYTITPKQWAAFREAHKTLARVGLASGSKGLLTCHLDPFWIRSEADIDAIDRAAYEPNRLSIFSAHVMGGCGMSDDPKKGVVRSEDLRHHALENLHVIDGSVFPTSLGVNPQESIYGLAHLMATRIAATSA
jgi:choline dehydrogenase-like flavoprotein